MASFKKKIGLKTLLFPIFVVIAIVLGLELGIHFKSTSSTVATYGIPLGLFFMIYPAMTKVRIRDFAKSLTNIKSVSLVLFLNYVIDPFLVAGLGYLFFYLVFYRLGLISINVANQAIVGVILLGVAPCIAMVMVWTDLSKGNLALGVSFVAWNSIIQIFTTPFLVYLLARTTVFINSALILESVLLYLALPLLAGVITRQLLHKKAYFSKLLNILSNVQTIALLFTIVVMFWSEGSGIIEYPSLIWMMAIIMLSFYFILFHIGYFSARKLKYNYQDSTAIGYTVSARDFEVAIAIAIVAFSKYPFVPIITAIGPLLEIPLMLVLVWTQLNRFSRLSIGIKASKGIMPFNGK
jgi:ACR3 family arsenite transporter